MPKKLELIAQKVSWGDKWGDKWGDSSWIKRYLKNKHMIQKQVSKGIKMTYIVGLSHTYLNNKATCNTA